ncbi:PHA/PHB synthase family protein [Zavarzinia aquatilis]|uniref:Poly-beta-hydroxybutyrate polymerase n=1 Tax=Zavarzinia aquatilis TaxID=2211142 RepID=A0A317E7E2_9PROT|nr:alpha/beta fold hydrolase [Zavarzinia aquatilis]PWR21323.1 poly-beta-hydroxybutyrate polymerase [Zavarzinia aquatilis]
MNENTTSTLDRLTKSATARLTGGISPTALMAAYSDWLLHLAGSPGKQLELVEKALTAGTNLMRFAAHSAFEPEVPAPHPAQTVKGDHRFDDPAWERFPFNLLAQSFLTTEQWWHEATTGVRGETRQHSEVVSFVTRQLLDMMAPTNFIATNPVVLEQTMVQHGANLIRGLQNFIEDTGASLAHTKPSTNHFEVGVNLAVSPGKVILRNRLIELIQYSPTTSDVFAEPILFVPAWIMKYYILDLSPVNSLVKYLTDRGHTVFMISWKNPDGGDRDLGMEDYLRLGVMAALDAINAVVPGEKVHATGYCLGGTLLSIAAAAMARDGDSRLASITLFAAQTDFTEPGEIGLFINESQVTFLEDMMWQKGYLATGQMAGAFQLLRSNDLIWSRIIHDYLLGQREEMIDLMAWNADATRMPYKMHSEYLRHLFLENELARAQFRVGERAIALTDIRAPIFAVGTVADHVAPWKSVFKIHQLTDTDVTFLLTSGGHNAGIVAGPENPRRHYQISHHGANECHVEPDAWARTMPEHKGSWWPAWAEWIEGKQAGRPRVAPPATGNDAAGYSVLEEAPGSYVHQP